MGAVGYTGGDPNKVDIAGDTMTGPLILNADPVVPLGAATKQFAESSGGGGGGGTPSNTVVTETSFGQASAAGASTNFSRGDHTHGTPAAPAAPPSASGTVVTETAYSQASSAGAAATFSRGDHTHGTPALPTPGAIGAATTGALAAHDVDTTAVHGIADTAQLATLTDIAGRQPLDGDLTTIAGLTPTTDNIIQSVAGAWASRTPAQVKTALALNNVDNTSDANKPVSTAQQTALNLKADLASPTFTGTPAAPTAGAGTSTTQLATTAFVTTADNLKANLASPTFTGTPAGPTAAQGTNTTQLATTAYVQTETGLLVPKSLVDAKGDLLVGTANDTVGRLAVGSDGQVLTADSAQSSGVKWAAAAGGGSGLTLARALVPANGRFYATLPGPNGTNLAVTLNRLYAMALPMGVAKQLDTIAVDVAVQATGGSGSVLRAMLLSATAGGLPDVALADFGTKSAESTGQKSWGAAESVNEALSANTVYYIGIVAQTSVAGGLALRTVNSYDPYVGDSVAVSGTASFGAYYNNGITGTLAGAFTITSVDTAIRVSVSFS